MVKIFSSELSRCRKVKFIFGLLLTLSAFVIFIVFPILWFIKAPIPKTSIDFVKEYITDRMNYTPETAYKAYHSKYQYIFSYYDEAIKDELDYIEAQRIYQYIVIDRVGEIEGVDGEFIVRGNLVKLSCTMRDMCKKLIDKKVKVYVKEVKARKFIIKEIKE